MLKNEMKAKKMYCWVNIVLVAIFTISVYFLIYKQAHYDGATGRYLSDLPLHMATALDGRGYSLMASLFRCVYAVLPSYMSIIVLLMMISASTVFAVALFLAFLLKDANDGKLLYYKYIPLALGLMVVSTVYVPKVYPFFYSGTYLTQPWHNSTYLLMRLFGVLVLLVYFKMEEQYLTNVSVKDAILFAGLLTVTNYAKPNFIIAFAPMMLIYLIIDFVRTRGKSCLQNIKFGVCVLASLPILYVQSAILYPEGGESKIIFTLGNIMGLLSNWRVLPYFVCGLLFPLVVTLLLWIKGKMSKRLWQSWVMWGISWLQRMFLTETGYRAGHGNFGWGVRFFSFVLVAVCATEWIRAYKNKQLTAKEFYIGCICLLLHIVCGIYYYIYLLWGNYYMK